MPYWRTQIQLWLEFTALQYPIQYSFIKKMTKHTSDKRNNKHEWWNDKIQKKFLKWALPRPQLDLGATAWEEWKSREGGMWKKVERTPLWFLNVNAPIYAECFIPGWMFIYLIKTSIYTLMWVPVPGQLGELRQVSVCLLPSVCIGKWHAYEKKKCAVPVILSAGMQASGLEDTINKRWDGE